MAVGSMRSVDHRADAAATDQFDPLADQMVFTFHNHPLHIAIRPDAAMIGGALRRVTRTQILISGGTILIFLLRRLVLLQLVLILLLLRLILGIVGIGLGG